MLSPSSTWQELCEPDCYKAVGESWEDVNWDNIGRHTCVNQELGTFCHLLYPGMVIAGS
jgi:hypothetical protein